MEALIPTVESILLKKTSRDSCTLAGITFLTTPETGNQVKTYYFQEMR